jgi:hypothetical protein
MNKTREIADMILGLDESRQSLAMLVDDFASKRMQAANRIAELMGRSVREVLEELPTVPRPRGSRIEPQPELPQIGHQTAEQTQ